MAVRDVTWTILNADSEPIRRTVICHLHAGDGGGEVAAGSIVSEVRAQSDGDTGIVTFSLEPNANISPAGSWYSFTVDHTTPTVVRHYLIPTGTGSVDLDDLTQIELAPPGVQIPKASTDPGKYLRSKDDGSGFELVDAPGGGGVSVHNDLTGRSSSNAHPASAITYQDGFTVADGLAYLTGALADAATAIATKASTASVTALTGVVTALDAEVDRDRADFSDALRGEVASRHGGEPVMALCTDWGGGPGPADGAYLFDPPGDFTTGAYLRAEIEVLPLRGLDDPDDGDQVYSEIWTQTHDGIGVWDNFEFAAVRVWDAAAGVWRAYLFIEWTEEGGTVEAQSHATYGSITTAGRTYEVWEIPPGRQEVAAHLDFANGDGNWDLSFWHRTYAPLDEDDPDMAEFDDARWRRVARKIGDGPTSIDTGVTDDWGFGRGQGRVNVLAQTVRDVDATGAIMAAPTAALAYAAGSGESFTDGINTYVPGPLATVAIPGEGALELGETSDSAYRGDRGKTAYDHSQVTSGNPHGTTAADVGAAATSHVHAASAITSGTLDVARLPVGTGSTQVAAGNDSRFSPWHAEIICATAWNTSSGIVTRTADSASLLGGFLTLGNTTGYYAEWKRRLSAGTWDIVVVHRQVASNGIGTISIDGTDVGTVNHYAASTARNVVSTISGVAVTGAGPHLIRVRNSSAGTGGSHTTEWQSITFIRTA